MAKGKKTGGRDIKPGQVLNPNGARGYPEEIKNLSKWTAIEFRAYVLQYLQLSLEELGEVLKNKDAPVIDHLIGKVLYEAIKRGDYQRMQAILDRCIGKVSDNLNVTSKRPFILQKLNGAIIEMGMGDKEN